MTDHREQIAQLKASMDTLEAQRSTIGDITVDLGLKGMNLQLAELEGQKPKLKGGQKYDSQFLEEILKDEQNLTNKGISVELQILKTIINLFPGQIFIKNKKDEFILCNDEQIQHLGSSPEEVYGKTSRDFHPKVLADPIVADDLKVLQTGESIINREEKVSAENGFIWLSTSKVPLHDSSGNIIGLLGFSQDITERKKTEAALKESETRFRTLFEQDAVGVGLMDSKTGRFLKINKKYSDMVGYTQEEMKTLTFQDITHPDDLQLGLNKIEELKNGKVDKYSLEKRYVNENGSNVWANLIVVPLWHHGGDRKYHMVVVEDITERKKLEQVLKESKDRLQLITDNVPIMIAYMSKDLRFQYANNYHEKIYKMPPEKIVGTHVKDVIGDTAYKIAMPYYKRVLSGESVEFENTVASREMMKYRKATLVPHQVDGVIEGYIALIQDITEYREMENELRQAHKMEALGTLAGGIAHDFNNILVSILGNAQILMQKLPDHDEWQDHLQRITRGGKRATNLVQQILTFSRMDTSSLKPVNLVSVLAEALKIVRATIPANIEIHQNLPANSSHIMADATQIHQIVLNLCTNAYHALKETGGRIEVALKELHQLPPPIGNGEDNYLQLTVRDNGHGISLENQEKIFDPFFTTKAVGKGTGLGLSVVHGIVEKHRGKITLESEIDKGTSFSIYFPVTTEKPSEEPTKVISMKKGSGSILIVEDELDIGVTYKLFLEGQGYTVTVCGNGLEALALLKKTTSKFDLVFTDQAMPHMTGKELAQTLSVIQPNLPIILSTGYSEGFSEEDALELGIRKYLLKPFDLVTFQRAIDECLKSSD